MSFTSLTIMYSSWCNGTCVQSSFNSACIFARLYMRCTGQPYHHPPYVVCTVDASLPYFFLHRHNDLLFVSFRLFDLYTILINWPDSNPSLHWDIKQYTRLTCLCKIVDIMIIHTWRCQSTDQNITFCRPIVIRSRRPICITIHSTASFFCTKLSCHLLSPTATLVLIPRTRVSSLRWCGFLSMHISTFPVHVCYWYHCYRSGEHML